MLRLSQVSEAGDEGPWDSVGPKGWDSTQQHALHAGDTVSPEALSRVKIALSLASAEDPRAAAFMGSSSLLRAWSDRSGTQSLDPGNLTVSKDSTSKVWVSLDASQLKSSRDVDGLWLRLKVATALASGCPLSGTSRCRQACHHHPGHGEVLPVWSPFPRNPTLSHHQFPSLSRSLTCTHTALYSLVFSISPSYMLLCVIVLCATDYGEP